MGKIYIIKRGQKYYYRRRVPGEVKHLDKRNEVKISLKTEDYNQALLKAGVYNEHIENFWRSLVLSGQVYNIEQKYQTAVQIAKSYGFAYKTAEQIATAQLEEVVERLSYKNPSEIEAAALLGNVEESLIMLSNCWELYEPLIVDRLVNKSEHQIRKWKNPRKAALNNFIRVVGDKAVGKLERSDIIQFRQWLNGLITEGKSANTANKQLTFTKDILQTVVINRTIEIDIEMLFTKTQFRYDKQSRPPFEAEYVQNVLLPELVGVETEDRFIMYAIADTGARIAEIFGLTKEDIRLEGDIPFIWIRPREGYELKTKTSERKIPLVGTSLLAFKNFQNGFSTKGNPDVFSTRMNKLLASKELRPSSKHTVYSLRHTFKDRLRDAEAPEEIIDGLMGHKKSGPKYGRGHKLETKHKWLSKIAYQIPDEFKS